MRKVINEINTIMSILMILENNFALRIIKSRRVMVVAKIDAREKELTKVNKNINKHEISMSLDASFFVSIISRRPAGNTIAISIPRELGFENIPLSTVTSSSGNIANFAENNCIPSVPY